MLVHASYASVDQPSGDNAEMEEGDDLGLAPSAVKKEQLPSETLKSPEGKAEIHVAPADPFLLPSRRGSSGSSVTVPGVCVHLVTFLCLTW